MCRLVEAEEEKIWKVYGHGVLVERRKKTYKTKAEEFLELERFRESQQRRVSIVPSTEEQQQNYVSILHPEEFPPKTDTIEKEPHQHHQHLHNVGYHEWMKKFVDHNSSHLATSDSDSDTDVSLDEVRMLPLFCANKHVKWFFVEKSFQSSMNI